LTAKSTSRSTSQTSRKAIRTQANDELNRIQRFVGVALIFSAIFGIYLLATDGSLWLLAASHAYGLIAICAIDVALGALNLLGSRKAIILSIGWAFLTIFLQLGDIATAPQYNMTAIYFAGYLFGLWAFDAILIVQALVIALGLSTRKYSRILTKQKQQNYFEMGIKSSRRDFMQIMAAIGGFVILAAGLGIWDTISSPNSSPNNTTQTSVLPSGAIANVNSLQVGVPIYFDYPSSGSTNMLLKKADGTLVALSVLCTHVCCQCQFDNTSNNIACPCHGSLFDLNGNVLRGPAASPLPSIQITTDSNGNVFPQKIVGSSPCVSA
jgi:cytochrome b6-f complex iron-sulfur subunit